ncbi:MAG TPA: HAD family hydrolase [Ktedonobacterales bacterium]|nr:HAD family hydrolase [Ktedonobacterales bacterium]
MRLVLFDIDGTLMRGAPPVHRQALCEAASVVFGVRLVPAEFGQTAGMTDSAIARRELRSVGVSDEAITQGLAAFCVAAADAYERLAPDDLRAYHTPHASATLDWLLARNVTLGLVTGNIERIAWRKLSAAGLAERFAQRSVSPGAPDTGAVSIPWIGGFGDQAEDRAALPPLALARATRLLEMAPQPRDTWVVGDTPADISCGVAHGLRAIAVATGPVHSLDDLRACGPDAALRDLSELPETILAR